MSLHQLIPKRLTMTDTQSPVSTRPIDDLVAAAQRYQDIAHVDWASTAIGSRERDVAREEYIRARAYCDGIIAARQLTDGRVS